MCLFKKLSFFIILQIISFKNKKLPNNTKGKTSMFAISFNNLLKEPKSKEKNPKNIP